MDSRVGDGMLETDLEIGPSAIENYSRLSYSMWYALGEFIDNSTQSRANYSNLIDEVLKAEGRPLVVEIVHNRQKKELRISDYSIGMNRQTLIDALKIARPTKDSKGRSQYGMGLKTAACWIGRRWRIVTCEWGSGEEWTADVDVKGVANGKRIPLTLRTEGITKDDHYTHIIISDLHRLIASRTEDTIREYLGSMYRFDLQAGALKIIYNGTEVQPPETMQIDTDPEGRPWKADIDTVINGKPVRGWFAVLSKGGRKLGGFSLFRHRRQIQGYPNAWKPQTIYGGVDVEGANNLVAQRLTGLLELDDFKVSHTKDAIQWEDDDEEKLEAYLAEKVKSFKEYAQRRRGEKGQPLAKEKLKELVEGMRAEFISGELKDAINNVILPPLETIEKNNTQQATSLTDDERLAVLDVLPNLRVVVSLQERSEYDPHVTIVQAADPNTIHVIINGLHPYYSSLVDKGLDVVDECVRQYIYDAIAEYRVVMLIARKNPDSVRRMKNDLLRAQIVKMENAAREIQDGEVEALKRDLSGGDVAANAATE